MSEAPKVGDIIVNDNGTRWRVTCEHEGTLGLEPVGVFHRLYWWVRFKLPW